MSLHQPAAATLWEGERVGCIISGLGGEGLQPKESRSVRRGVLRSPGGTPVPPLAPAACAPCAAGAEGPRVGQAGPLGGPMRLALGCRGPWERSRGPRHGRSSFWPPFLPRARPRRHQPPPSGGRGPRSDRTRIPPAAPPDAVHRDASCWPVQRASTARSPPAPPTHAAATSTLCTRHFALRPSLDPTTLPQRPPQSLRPPAVSLPRLLSRATLYTNVATPARYLPPHAPRCVPTHLPASA